MADQALAGTRMKVLMAFHAPPYPAEIGPSRRHYHLLAETIRRHQVGVLSLGSDDDCRALLANFPLDPARVRFVPGDRGVTRKMLRSAWFTATGRSDFRRLHHRRFQRALDAMLAADHYDLLFLSTLMLGCYRLPTTLPLLADVQNVEHETLARAAAAARGGRRWFFRMHGRRTRREELRYLRRVALVCATSRRDATLLHCMEPSVPVAVVPDGVDRRAGETLDATMREACRRWSEARGATDGVPRGR